ncbi:hypothetical protein PAXRUDRAFT_17045 [Paxillus rubicundulus Ve08.2h10]|uniref:Uncharacterized protein n=1 Tax=Paxillus rubicundulus Ve08.2h10 TaxID=930991 RepID=A0A0D0CRY1_9AGAM|nr:hypothetical protein PAXRUDRAFT_17045 [Paxillus rubicundulus Ve08.2h10]
MVDSLNNVVIGEKLKTRLFWLNQQGLQHFDRPSTQLSSPTKAHTVYIPPVDEVANYEACLGSLSHIASNYPTGSNNRTVTDTGGPPTELPYMQQAEALAEPPYFMHNTQAGPSTGPFTQQAPTDFSTGYYYTL